MLRNRRTKQDRNSSCPFPHRPGRRPLFEMLEARLCLATFSLEGTTEGDWLYVDNTYTTLVDESSSTGFRWARTEMNVTDEFGLTTDTDPTSVNESGNPALGVPYIPEAVSELSFTWFDPEEQQNRQSKQSPYFFRGPEVRARGEVRINSATPPPFGSVPPLLDFSFFVDAIAPASEQDRFRSSPPGYLGFAFGPEGYTERAFGYATSRAVADGEATLGEITIEVLDDTLTAAQLEGMLVRANLGLSLSETPTEDQPNEMSTASGQLKVQDASDTQILLIDSPDQIEIPLPIGSVITASGQVMRHGGGADQ